MKELSIRSLPGIPMLIGLAVLSLLLVWGFIEGAAGDQLALMIACLLGFVVTQVLWFGLYMVEPNQAAVLSLFGRYIGTVKEQGLRYNNPFYSTKKISLRIRNFESGKLKPVIYRSFPLEQAAEAHTLMESSTHVGKIVLQVL